MMTVLLLLITIVPFVSEAGEDDKDEIETDRPSHGYTSRKRSNTTTVVNIKKCGLSIKNQGCL
jgi:hypothetical protein